jgi:predicted MFS family arabinose efflux permease
MHHPSPGVAGRGRPIVLGVLCLATFLVNGSATAIAPFLLEVARDLSTDLAAAGNLVSLSSLTWGVASLFAGAASDRLGRKPILLFGLVVLIASPLGVALANDYAVAAAWRLVGGVGGGAFMGTVFAAVSDQFPAAERGRALGWIVTGQSLSLVLGVPLVTFIGAFVGWRGATGMLGLAILVATLGVWFVLPRSVSQRGDRQGPRIPILKLLTPRVVALFGANTMERLCFAAVVVYLATYLIASYGVSLQELALGLALVALGNLVGNVIGGHITDRLPARPLVAAVTLAVTAALALPLLLWQPGVATSIALGLAYSLVNALGRPALLAAVSEVSSEARGTLMGLNITFSSFGWLGASALGGVLITSFGFEALGILAAAAGLIGAALAALSWVAGVRLAAR